MLSSWATLFIMNYFKFKYSNPIFKLIELLCFQLSLFPSSVLLTARDKTVYSKYLWEYLKPLSDCSTFKWNPFHWHGATVCKWNWTTGAGLTPDGRQAKVSEFSQRLFLLLKSAEINRHTLRLPQSFCSWGMIDFCPLRTLCFYALLFFKVSHYQWTGGPAVWVLPAEVANEL